MALNGEGVQPSATGMHRRKSSKEEEDNVLIIPNADQAATPELQLPPFPNKGRKTTDNRHSINGDPKNGHPTLTLLDTSSTGLTHGHINGKSETSESDQRSRVSSPPANTSPQNRRSPAWYPSLSPSSGPNKTTFAPQSRPPPLNGMHGSNGNRTFAPQMRPSFSLPSHSAHSKTRSVSGPFLPSSPSPLATSFGTSHSTSSLPPQPPTPLNFSFPASQTDPEIRVSAHDGTNGNALGMNRQSSTNSRRHSRLHSRNLSMYFPRPGSIPSTIIDEDGGQEVDFSSSKSLGSSHSGKESVLMPSVSSPGPGQRSFREGFTFGVRPPLEDANDDGHPMPPLASSVSRTSRRGHHHKHSLSHNFFSFLEPGAPENLQTQPALTPVSPWNPISPFTTFPDKNILTDSPETLHGSPNLVLSSTTEKDVVGRIQVPPRIDPAAGFVAIVQFIIGASLWVVGQQIGSLSCTGLGYWVVFDSFGVALGRVLPGWLAKAENRSSVRRSYGNARIETLMTYAQSVYLLFASVYVCKETVEHMLLSEGEGHHHHAGDEVSDVFGIDFPPFLLLSALLSLVSTAVLYYNQAKLVSATGNHVPSIPSLLPFRVSYNMSHYNYPPLVANLLTNPYVLAPIGFSASILSAFILLPPYYHRPFDLLLAGVETVVTFALAYPASVALGSVLLQTAPAQGLPGGRTEALSRAIREIERHPDITHLPSPHFWQLTPHFSRPVSMPSLPSISSPTQSLIVTMELNVRHDLEEDEAIKLSKWAEDKCRSALRLGSREGGGEGEAEVTVGVVWEK